LIKDRFQYPEIKTIKSTINNIDFKKLIQKCFALNKRNNKCVLPCNRIEVCESYPGMLVKFGNNKNNLESE
jgi:hypothetical protein